MSDPTTPDRIEIAARMANALTNLATALTSNATANDTATSNAILTATRELQVVTNIISNAQMLKRVSRMVSEQ